MVSAKDVSDIVSETVFQYRRSKICHLPNKDDSFNSSLSKVPPSQLNPFLNPGWFKDHRQETTKNDATVKWLEFF